MSKVGLGGNQLVPELICYDKVDQLRQQFRTSPLARLLEWVQRS